MNYKNIDELDYEILDLLEQNARLSHSEIGKQLHLSRTAVANRIKALEDAGKINGYTTLTNYELHTNFLLTITTTPEDNKSVLNAFKKERWCEVAMRTSEENKIIVFCSLRNRIEYKMMMRAFAADVKGILKTEVLEIGHLDKGMFFRQ